MAPELFDNTSSNQKIDVYALGMVIWGIFYRQEPFSKFKVNGLLDVMKLVVVEEQRPSVDTKFPRMLALLYKDLIAPNFDERPVISDVLSQVTSLMQDKDLICQTDEWLTTIYDPKIRIMGTMKFSDLEALTRPISRERGGIDLFS